LISLLSITSWDRPFFDRFVSFRNRCYRKHDDVLLESIESFERQFGVLSPFSREHEWKAWLATDEVGIVRGRIVAGVRRPDLAQISTFAFCGFFESDEDGPTPGDVAKALLEAASAFAAQLQKRYPHIQSLRGPIQGSFYYGYRLRLAGGGKHFLGEPNYPDLYHEHFKNSGFDVCEHYQTVEITRKSWMTNLEKKGLPRTSSPWKKSGVKVRQLNVRRWDDEVVTLHRLIVDCFSEMPMFSPISLDEFRSIYDSYRYLVHPDMILIAEHEDRPVGFMMAMYDQLPVLLAHQRREVARPVTGWRAQWRKLATLARLRLNRKSLLFYYVGKVPGLKVKGVMAALGTRLMFNAIRRGAKTALICYLFDNSHAYASLPDACPVHAEYVLYERKL